NSHGDTMCLQALAELLFPGPIRSRPTAKQVERRSTKLRPGMAGQMRFGQQVDRRDSARPRELIPDTSAHSLEPEIRDDSLEQASEQIKIRKPARAAARDIDQPFTCGELVNRRGLIQF